MLGNHFWIEPRGHFLHWGRHPSPQQGHPSSRVGRRSLTPDSTSTRAADGIIAMGFLALVWIITLAGLLILFSWVTAELPSTAQATCPRVENCVPPALIEDPVLGMPSSHYPEPAEAP